MSTTPAYEQNPPDKLLLGIYQQYTMTFLIFFAVTSLIACLFLGKIGLILLVGAVLAVIFLPFLLQNEKKIFWLWLVGFPLVYYEPVRLSDLFLGSNSTSLLPLFVLIAAPGAVISLFTRARDHLKILPVTLPLWFFMIGLTISALRILPGTHPIYVIREFALLFVFLYMIVVCWKMMANSEKARRILFNTFLWMGVLNAITIIIQYIFKTGLIVAGGFARPMGLFGFPIGAAIIGSFILMMALYKFFTTNEKRQKVIYGATSLLIMLGCLLTLSKTNMIQLVLSLCLWGLFLPRQFKKQALLASAGLGVLLVLWVVFLDNGNMLTLISDRFARTDTLSVRQEAWKIMSEHMDLSTLLFGHGWVSSAELLATYNYRYQMFPMDLTDPVGITAIHPHNAFLKFAYELGLFGIGLIISYFWIMYRGFADAIRKATLKQKLAGLTIGTQVFCILFNSITGSPMAEIYFTLAFTVSILLLAYEAGWFKSTEQPPPTTG